MQTIAEMFKTTRGGKYRKGRCEACDEPLEGQRQGLCDTCQDNDLLDEEKE